jgi:adenylosuccinate synthase
MDYHKKIDTLQETMKGKSKIGTTGRGIGPAYSDKINRMGLRVGELPNWKNFENHYRSNLAYHKKMYRDLNHDEMEELTNLKRLKDRITPYITDTAELLASEMRKKKRILLEGANATMLDIDHGTYPFVTSSNASIGGIITGTGIPPRSLTSIIGIVKAYTTRVGAGPFPSELFDATGEYLREKGGEYGATTGRPRRCGWFDAVVVRYAAMMNGLTHINLTKLDVLTGLKKIKICTEYRSGKPHYIELPGWNESIGNAKNLS